MVVAGVQEIARRNHRIHEGVGKGFFAASSSEMINNGDTVRHAETVFARKQVAADDFDARIASELIGIFGELRGVAAGAHQATQVAKSLIQQAFDDARPDKSISAGDKNRLLGGDDIVLKCGHGRHREFWEV